MSVKARGTKNSPVAQHTREIGEALGFILAHERRRNRRWFALLWLALVALTLYVVLT